MKTLTLTDKVFEEFKAKGIKLFINNTGQAWKGDLVNEFPQSTRAGKTLGVELINAHRVPYGLCPGSSRLIGYEETKITQDMVGKKIACFVAIETGAPGYDRLNNDQKRFINDLLEAGGKACVARQTNIEIQIDELQPVEARP